MNKFFALLAVAAMVFAFGCIGVQQQGGQNGNAAAPASPAPKEIFLGNSANAHGCKEASGYFWCEVKKKCLNILEEKCEYDPGPSTLSVAPEICTGANGTIVDGDACADGYYPFANIIDPSGINRTCCLAGQLPSQAVGGDRDSHGCIPSAGYAWCEPKQKCLRSWEEACDAGLSPIIGENSTAPMMSADECAGASGVAMASNGMSACSEGTYPIAEISGASGAKKYCCKGAGAYSPPPAAAKLCLFGLCIG